MGQSLSNHSTSLGKTRANIFLSNMKSWTKPLTPCCYSKLAKAFIPPSRCVQCSTAETDHKRFLPRNITPHAIPIAPGRQWQVRHLHPRFALRWWYQNNCFKSNYYCELLNHDSNLLRIQTNEENSSLYLLNNFVLTVNGREIHCKTEHTNHYYNLTDWSCGRDKKPVL